MRNYFVITYTSQINVTFGTSSVVTRWRYFKEPFDLIKKHATAESHTLILGHMDQWLPWKRWVSVRPYVSLGWRDRREKERDLKTCSKNPSFKCYKLQQSNHHWKALLNPNMSCPDLKCKWSEEFWWKQFHYEKWSEEFWWK